MNYTFKTITYTIKNSVVTKTEELAGPFTLYKTAENPEEIQFITTVKQKCAPDIFEEDKDIWCLKRWVYTAPEISYAADGTLTVKIVTNNYQNIPVNVTSELASKVENMLSSLISLQAELAAK